LTVNKEKNEHDKTEWIVVQIGNETMRVTAKRNNHNSGIAIVFDAPRHIKIIREELINKKDV